MNLNNFTMTSLGRSNINRKFYLIALCLLSKEEIEDYVRFLEAFKLLCNTFNINCCIMFMMQDACQSEAPALEVAYPNTITLMYNFHVIKNVKERLRGNKRKGISATDDTLHSTIMKDISCMHYSRSIDEFEILLNIVYIEWSNIPEMKNFLDYFWNQWVNNQRTNKWQIFRTPPRYASANNQRDIKGTTKKSKGHMLTMNVSVCSVALS